MDSRLSRQVTHRRYLPAGPRISHIVGLLLAVGVLIQACSDNNGRVTPTFPAGQTGRTALALFPTTVTFKSTSDAGKCKEQVQFLATGGEEPYTFRTALSGSGSTIDSSGLYKLDVDPGTFTDTVLVIDAIGATKTATVSITCT